MSTARVTQSFAQVLSGAAGAARVTQSFAQVLSGGAVTSARVTQSFAQVLSARPQSSGTSGTNIPPERIIFVAKIEAIDDNGDPVVELATNGPGWRTRPTDTPANQHIAPTMDNPGTYRREMFSGNRAFGAVRPSFGAATFLNRDGRYDYMRTYGFDGQSYTVYWGEHGAEFPSQFTVAFKCVATAGEVDFETMTLRLGDRMRFLQKPILGDTFAGTGGLEGGDDLTGKPKQRIFGSPIYFPLQPIIQTTPSIRYEEEAQTYQLAPGYNGKPTASQVIFRYAFPMGAAVMFPAGLTGSSGSAGTAATGSTVFSLKKDGVEFATMTFAAGATTPTFSAATETYFGEYDVLTVVAPASPDSTLANFSYTLIATVVPVSALPD